MLKKIQLLMFLLVTGSITVYPALKVVPYSKFVHVRLLVQCAKESYQHLFTNSKLSSFGRTRESRADYGQMQAIYLAEHVNRLGKILNSNGSVTTIQILELNELPIGYIKYTSPHSEPMIGSIDQMALLNEFRAKGYGKLLMQQAKNDFLNDSSIKSIRVITTSKEVGDKFYEKFGFSYDGEFKSKYPDAKIYQWSALCRP